MANNFGTQKTPTSNKSESLLFNPSKEVDDYHVNSDKDRSAESHHHTLGPKSTQAAPGDHVHRTTVLSQQSYTMAALSNNVIQNSPVEVYRVENLTVHPKAQYAIATLSSSATCEYNAAADWIFVAGDGSQVYVSNIVTTHNNNAPSTNLGPTVPLALNVFRLDAQLTFLVNVTNHPNSGGVLNIGTGVLTLIQFGMIDGYEH